MRRRALIVLGGLLAVGLLAAVVAVLKLHHRATLEKLQREAAMDALDLGIQLNASATQPYAKEALIPAFQKGKALLEKRPAPDFSRPILLLAAFTRAVPRGNRLTLMWLESGFRANGIVVESGDGTVLTSCHLVFWTADERARLDGHLLWDTSVWVLEPGEVLPDDVQHWGEVHLPKTALKGQLRVKLLLNDGSTTAPVAAYVDPQLRKEQAPSGAVEVLRYHCRRTESHK